MKRSLVNLALVAGLCAASGSVLATELTAADVTDPTTQFYDAANGHIYQIVNSAVTWTEAFNTASSYSLDGVQGYLVTITSQAENDFVFNVIQSTVSTGWDGRSIWLGASDAANEGTWNCVDGPEAGTQFWQGEASGSGLAGVYNNMYAPYIQNENGACGISGCWSNPTGTGADYLFMYGGAYTPGYWDDAYSSPTAVSSPSSPIASADGLRNAYVIEYGRSVPEPATTALLLTGVGFFPLLRRRS